MKVIKIVFRKFSLANSLMVSCVWFSAFGGGIITFFSRRSWTVGGRNGFRAQMDTPLTASDFSAQYFNTLRTGDADLRF